MADDTPAPDAPKKAKERPEQRLVEQSRPGRPTVEELGFVHETPAWLFEAASALHGWKEHAHAFAREMRLTGEIYEAALDAARRPNGLGEYEPHEAALSPAKKKPAVEKGSR